MNHFPIRQIAVLIAAMLISACSHLSDDLKTAEKLIEDKPDSSLSILNQISPEKISEGENRALYNLLYIRALDKKHLPLKPDSLLDYPISWYEKHPEGNRLAYALLYKGRQYYYDLKYEKATNSFLKSRDEVRDSSDYLLMGRICADMARVSSMQKDYNYSREKMKQALKYYQKGNCKYQYFYTMIELGRSFSLEKDCKSAISYFRKIDKLVVDSMTKGDLLDQYAFAYYNTGKVDSALYYYRQIINYPYMTYNRAIRYMYLADVYFDLQKFDSSEYFAMNAFKFKPELRTQRECHRILANLAYLKNDKKAEIQHMNQYVYLGETLRKIDSQTKGSFLENMHKSSKEAKSAREHNLYLLLLIAFFMLVFGWLYMRANRKHRESETTLLQKHEKAKLQSKDELRQELIEVLKQKIKDSKKPQAEMLKKASPAEREVLIREFYTDLLHLDDWNKFSLEMCPMFGNLPQNLETNYPTLTHKEIIWCFLFLLDISQSDILSIMEYKQGSYSKLKQRIAKKLKLTDATELNDFLRRKVSEQ